MQLEKEVLQQHENQEGNTQTQEELANETRHPTEPSNTTEDRIIDDISEPPAQTTEEREMDNMFEEANYPSMNEIENAEEPQVGMSFATREDAFYAFKIYARKKGFAVRKDASYTSRITGQLERQMFVCNRSGKPICTDGPGRKRRSNVLENTNCKVLVRVKLELGLWVVTAVHLEHNHELAPSTWLVRFMRCHKNMNESEKNFIGVLQNSRVPPRKVMSIFRLLRGHLRCIGFDAKDVSNLQSKERMQHKHKDIAELLDIFKDRQKTIPGFYYSVMADEDGTVRSIFWTDAIGIANYKVYGDYMSFDTTFSTNLYGMPFAPIIGVNNHGKTILFGCALLKDQTISTFEWLFDTFLIANNGKMPSSIISDQDQSIASAIQSKFPTAVRRFCFWHIVKELKRKNVAFFAARPNLYKKLKYAVKNSFTIQEFEMRWNEILDEYQARENNSINYLYNIRRYWVPAYFMSSFYPFSSTTGRSESTNALFKGYVTHKETIVNFFEAYEQIQEKNLSTLDRCRFNSEIKCPSKWSFNGLEQHAATLYTTAIFQRVQKEFKSATAYAVKEIVPEKMFQLRRKTVYDSEFEKEEFEVTVTEDKEHFTCSCRKLDRDGIPCCHVLKIAERLDLLMIPASFVRYRWTKQADQEIVLQVGQELTLKHGNAANSIQYCLMMGEVSDYCSSISGNKRAVELFTAEFHKLKETINSKLTEHQDASGNQNGSTYVEGTSTTTLKNPPIPEERSNKKRRRSIAEKKEKQAIAKAKKKAAPKKNTVKRCTQCKSTLHDKKSCPEIGKMPQLPQVQHSA